MLVRNGLKGIDIMSKKIKLEVDPQVLLDVTTAIDMLEILDSEIESIPKDQLKNMSTFKKYAAVQIAMQLSEEEIDELTK